MDKWEKILDRDIQQIKKWKKLKIFLIISIILVLIGILIIIATPILFILALSGKTSYNTVSLKNIEEQEKQEIIELMELQEISEHIDLEKIRVPLVYKDIYYRIYFYVADSSIEITNNSIHKLGNNRYFYIISDKGRTIKLLENIIDKYKTTNNKLEENREELMSLLGIENSLSFLPISISTENLGLGDTTECYTLEFEISIEDYNKNSLNYKDIDTSETSLNWKEKKDEQTYICYVREWEYNENRKELFNELKELKSKY